MNATFLGLEIKRVVRDYGSMFFIVILPGFLYIIFGAAQDYSQESAGNGNVAMYIMVSMAGYGAATATTSIGGRAAVERAGRDGVTIGPECPFARQWLREHPDVAATVTIEW